MTPAAALNNNGSSGLGGVEGKKYVGLRKRLDQLGYRQSLGVDSLPLVEKVFNDLVHTTESLKKAKLQATRVVHETRDVESAVEPYALENARLLKEQNELRQKLIQKNDNIDTQVREFKDRVRKLEHESADLKFLNSQYLSKVRTLEKEVSARDQRIKDMQERAHGQQPAAVVHTAPNSGSRKKTGAPFRRQRMDIDSLLPADEKGGGDQDTSRTSGSGPRLPAAAPKDAYVADLLTVADQRIESLQQEVNATQFQLDTSEKKVASLKYQVESRDEEIDRLARLLETGRPHDSLASEARTTSNDKLIQHLNLQVDYLQNSNRELENRLRRSIEQKQDATHDALLASTDRAQLLGELEYRDRVAEKLSREKESVLDLADKEVAEAKEEIYKSQTELKFSEHEKSEMQTENDKLRLTIEKTQRNKSEVEAVKGKTEEALMRAEKIRNEQQSRIEELTKSERSLLMELEKLRIKKGGKPTQGGGAVSPTRLNHMLKSIEQERDYYKRENEKLVRRQGARSPTRAGAASATPTSSKQVEQLESVVRAMEDERDHYKREFERVRLRLDSDAQRPSRSPIRDRMLVDTEVQRLRRENKELQAMLDKCERHMSEIKTNVKVLTQENEKTHSLYEQANEEVQRLRRELMKSPKSAKASMAAQAILQRVEGERDEAISDLRRLTGERDTLREKLSEEHSSHTSMKARLESEVEELTQRLRPTEAERDELMHRVASLREKVAVLEDQVKTQSYKIRGVEDEAHEFKGESSQLRVLVEQAEKSLAETKYKLDKKTQELGMSEDNRAQLEVDLHSMRTQFKKEREEVSRLKGVVGGLDRDRDTLQGELDLKAEKIAALHHDIDSKSHHIGALNGEVADLEQQVLSLNDAVAGREREIKSLKRQLDSKSYECEELVRLKDAATAEIKRLQDDLGEMTRECQSISQQLNRTEQERDELKGKVLAYHKELQKQEDIIAAQEQEKNHLLSSYRQVQTEASRHEGDAHTYQAELSSARLELVSKDGEMRRMEERIREMDRDLKDYQDGQVQYEAQLSHQSSSLASVEGQVKALQQDKEAVLSDLAAVRELCVKLDSAKDSLQRKLAQKNIEGDQLANQLEDARQEIELLKKQCDSENQTIKNLEDLLTSNREKEFASQLSSQERETEIQLYKERLSLSETKSASLQRDMQALKTRLGTSEAELERSRRQLTNERFERERSEQDLRRIKQGRYSSPTRKGGSEFDD